MKAPKYAYIQDADGNFFKVVVTDGQLVSVYAPDPIDPNPHLVGCFVARYFKGSESEGGYATTPERMFQSTHPHGVRPPAYCLCIP